MNDLKSLRVCVDRVVPPQRASRQLALSLAESPRNLSGAVPPEAIGPSSMAILVQSKWALGRTLRIKFLDGIPSVQDHVLECAREWMDYADIQFEPVTTGPAEVRISFADNGSWSWIGNQALTVPISSPTMNYGWLEPGTPDEEYRRVVLHEFGHALGCIHEHQSPEADALRWDKEKVYAYFGASPNFWSREQVDQNIFNRYDRTETNFTRFDPSSIMLYQFPAELFLDGVATSNNTELSELDRQFMAAHYPKPPALPALPAAPEASRRTAHDPFDQLRRTDLSRMTPMEAFDLVRRLKEQAGPEVTTATVTAAAKSNGTVKHQRSAARM